MAMKIKIVAIRVLAGLAIFGSTASSAAQACLEMPGELNLASVEGSKRGEDFGMEYDLIHENRIRLDEKAAAICSGKKFCVEDTSIKTTFYFHPWTKVGRGSMTAVVNCLK